MIYLAPSFFGEKETVFTLIKLNLMPTPSKDMSTIDYVCKELAKSVNVKKVHGLFGENDILIEVKGETLGEIGKWLTTEATKLGKFVKSTESISALTTIKDTKNVQIKT